MDKQELIDKIKKLAGLTADERAELLALLHEHKKYGLVWEDKAEDVEERLAGELPVLAEVPSRRIMGGTPLAPNHILIEGDNLHALTALTYTHAERVDVIYITCLGDKSVAAPMPDATSDSVVGALHGDEGVAAPARMLIVYDERAIPAIVSLIKGHTEEETGHLIIYVFSPDRSAYEEQWAEVKGRATLCALPAAIYDAYCRVLKPAASGADGAAEGAGPLQVFEE